VGLLVLIPHKGFLVINDIDDEDLIKDAAGGDNNAFGMLYERYVQKIYSYIYYRTGNVNEAEDLTARVFHRSFKHIHNYDQRGVPFSAWLYRIAHNLVANWYRDRSRKKEVVLEDHIPSQFHFDFPENALERNQENEKLLIAIRKLPAERQQLIILKFVEGLSNAEIGVIMRKSEGAIKSLYHRTLTSIRKEVEKLENQAISNRNQK
jgi:RNA polymerase sigma-70 factor (ECF subfamily)